MLVIQNSEAAPRQSIKWPTTHGLGRSLLLWLSTWEKQPERGIHSSMDGKLLLLRSLGRQKYHGWKLLTSWQLRSRERRRESEIAREERTRHKLFTPQRILLVTSASTLAHLPHCLVSYELNNEPLMRSLPLWSNHSSEHWSSLEYLEPAVEHFLLKTHSTQGRWLDINLC